MEWGDTTFHEFLFPFTVYRLVYQMVYRYTDVWYTDGIPTIRRTMSKQIKVSDEVHQRLMGARKDTETVSDLISRLLDGATVQADSLLDQLDKQSEETYVDPLIRDLEPDELPECCQSIYGGSVKDRCEHWVDKRPAGFYNTLTHKWASDPDYYKYV